VTRDERRRWGVEALAAVLAVVAYQLSVFGVLFLLPLQWVYRRHGERPFLMVSIVVAVGIWGVAVLTKVVAHSLWSAADTVLLVFPLVLIAGWVVMVLLERLGWRFLYRLVAVTAACGLVLFPTVSGLLAQPALMQVVEKSFDEVWKSASQTPGVDFASLVGRVSEKEFFDLLKETFLGSFLTVLFLFWAFTGFVARVFTTPRELRTLKGFFLPSQGTWILLGLWGLILIKFLLALKGVDWEWGGVEYVVANLALIALVLHVAAGWGILHVLLDGWKVPRLGQTAVRVLLALVLLTPVVGTWLVLGGLAGLAVLELWVNFRKRTQGVGL